MIQLQEVQTNCRMSIHYGEIPEHVTLSIDFLNMLPKDGKDKLTLESIHLSSSLFPGGISDTAVCLEQVPLRGFSENQTKNTSIVVAQK